MSDAAPDLTPSEGSPGSAPDGPPGELTHLDERGRARMVDVGAKAVTERTAVAGCVVLMAPETARRLADGDLPKGDALPVARIAGIQAAKRTPELIPLCHQIALTSVRVDLDVDAEQGRLEVTATARATDRTGVEMEALTAASVAALTIYDLVKAVQKDVVISELRLLRKTGGRSGDIGSA
jgi:cyclic pyranopterin monophosphate synthase